MKKSFRKLCVFLLAVTFFGKSLYGDIQYAQADEYTGPEVTVTEEGEVIGEEPSVPSDEEEPGDDIQAPDVSDGDVSGDEPVDEDVSGGDVSGSVPVDEDISGGDVSGEDVSGGDVSGGDVEIEDEPVPGADEPEPVVETVVNKNTDITVLFFVLKDGYLGSIAPEKNGTDVTSNGQKRYEAVYTFKDADNYGLEYVLSNYSFENIDEVYSILQKGAIKHLSLPDEYGDYESISEKFGVDKSYGESGQEYLIENLVGNSEYVASLFAFSKEQASDGTDTKNIVYATGDMIDWYVLKHSDTNAWHADGFVSQAKVFINDDNKPDGQETIYTYDGVSKIENEAAVINTVIDAADDSLPGSYVVRNIVYKDASGNPVSEMVNVGSYTAVATVYYTYAGSEDELSYTSDDIEVLFPVTINKRTVTVTAHNNSKTVGQGDPTFTGSIEGAVAADPVSATFWRITGNEAVGTYPIYSTIIASSNYNVVSYDGVFTIYAASTPAPAPTPAPPAPTPGPEEEFPGVVPPAPAPAVTPAPAATPEPEPVVADETVEVDEEDVPLAETIEETTEDTDTLDVGEVYPPLRDLTIEDEETPLAAAPGECWIHWLIVLLTAVDVLYTVIQAFRNGAVIKKLKNGKE